MNRTDRLATILVGRYGLDLRAKVTPDKIEFSLGELHPHEGLGVQVCLGWRSIEATLFFGPFAAGILSEMAKADIAKKTMFASLAEKLMENGGEFTMQINGIPAKPTTPDEWSAEWKQFNLSVKKVPVMIDPHDIRLTDEQTLFWGGGLLGMVLSLLPLEDIAEEKEPGCIGLPEGAKYRIEVNRYERSRVNRGLCIAAHGSKCQICSFDFEAFYGPLGAGYINVHHIIPVSKMGASYMVNPVTDLIPVCPNCHAMLHRADPPLTAEELFHKMPHKH